MPAFCLLLSARWNRLLFEQPWHTRCLWRPRPFWTHKIHLHLGRPWRALALIGKKIVFYPRWVDVFVIYNAERLLVRVLHYKLQKGQPSVDKKKSIISLRGLRPELWKVTIWSWVERSSAGRGLSRRLASTQWSRKFRGAIDQYLPNYRVNH